jgi:hypothetical protein
VPPAEVWRHPAYRSADARLVSGPPLLKLEACSFCATCSLHKFRAPPGLPVSAVAQRREETLDALGSQLAPLPPDVWAVFAAAAEMGLPSSLLADVLRRYAALQQPQQGQGQAEADQAEPVSEGESDVSTVSDGVQ